MLNRSKCRLGFVAVTLAVSFVASASLAAEPSQSKSATPAIHHVDPQEAQKLIAKKQVIVLDIRTPGEFKTGRIAGARNIDFQAADFEKQLETLDKSKTYLVHCASGGRSTHSLLLFKKYEFQSVYHLDGGIKAWQKAGLPIEK